MSTKTIWKCDGCGDELTLGNGPSDWKRIHVKVSGFSGYPVSDYYNLDRSFELCTNCQTRLSAQVDPRTWEGRSEDKETK